MSFTTFQERALDIYTGQYMRISSQIDRLYGMIDDIRNNIMSTSNSQHRLLNVLVAQSERIFTKIEALYGRLDEIRDNIAYIIQHHESRQQTQRQSQGSRQQTQRQQQGSRLNSAFQNIRPNVVYDYRTPISPIEYVNTNTTRSTFVTQMSDILSSFLNTSVTIRPTAEQIDAASRLVRYGDIERPLSESCPISLDRFNIDDLVRQIHHCGHLFVPSQFDEWFQSNVRCPVCRFDVRNHVRDQNTRPTAAGGTTRAAGGTTRAAGGTTRLTTDPSGNEILFDLSGNEITDDLLNTLSSRFFESLFRPSTNIDNNDRFVYDPSNNLLMYETIVRRNTEHR
jgi:hypothetical protein